MQEKIIDNDTSDSVEKVKPGRKPFVQTEARKQAFERCRLARQTSVEKIQTGKKLKNLEAREQRIVAKKKELIVAEAEPEPEESESEPEPEPEPEPKKTRKPMKKTRNKPKAKVTIVEDSESGNSSDSEPEFIIQRVPKKKTIAAIAPSPQVERHTQLFSWV